MSTLYGVNHTKKYIDNPAEKIIAKQELGKSRWVYDKIVLAAELAVNDVVKLMKLPKGAKILNAIVKSPSLGTTGILDLGIEANGVDAADQDFFVASADAGGQAVQKSAHASLAAGVFVELGAETQVVLKCTEASDVGAGKTIEVAVEISLE